MSVLLRATLVLLLVAAATAQLGPTYNLRKEIDIDNYEDRREKNFSSTTASVESAFSNVKYYEWESFDGWFNNPAHPEWGGAGKPYKTMYLSK